MAQKCHNKSILAGPGGSKWLNLSRTRLDLDRIHPRWNVGAIWTHRNCPRGPPGGSKMTQKCHKTAISDHRWLQMAGSQWILVGSGWDTSRMVRWGHLDPPKLPWGPPGRSEMAQKCHKTRIYGHKWLRCLQMA